MLMCTRWYAAYALSLRTLEEIMAERGVIGDHATMHRCSPAPPYCNKADREPS
jgi:transposase-like protein